MDIKRIYYEELCSEQINGKWTSKKIGAEVNVEVNDALQDCLNCVKEYVRRNLDLEDFEMKTTKQMLEDISKQAKKIMSGI